MIKSDLHILMRKSSIIVFNLMIFIFFTACVPEVQQGLLLNDNQMGSQRGRFKSEIDPLTLSAVDRGMTRKDVETEIGSPRHSFIVENGSLEYLVDVHPVVIRIKRVIITASDGSTSTENIPIYGPYYMVYFQDHLWIWGRDEELKKNDNPALQQIIPTVTQGYIGEQLKVRKKMVNMQRMLYGIPSALFALVVIFAVTSS